MIQSIYLHKYVTHTLCLFGDLTTVINAVLKECADGNIELTGHPRSPSRQGAQRHNINITDPYYLQMWQNYPPNSSYISVRRLLYWFVDFEIYNMLGWKTVQVVKDDNTRKLLKQVDKIMTQMERLTVLAQRYDVATGYVDNVNKSLLTLKEYLDNEV